MEDYQIVDLYWARKEKAIAETEKKYGKMLHSLSYSLLSSHEDAEECVNDTYLGAWNTMPDARPMYLGSFLSKITRRLSIDRWRREHRAKRGGVAAVVEELSECIPDDNTPAAEYQRGLLRGDHAASGRSRAAARFWKGRDRDTSDVPRASCSTHQYRCR